MAVRSLTWPAGPRWTMDVQLSRRVFRIAANYNPRMDTWAIDVFTGDGDLLVTGVRVIRDWPLLPGWRDERFPPGQLLAVAPSGRVRGDPRREAFEGGQDAPFRLVYVEPEDA